MASSMHSRWLGLWSLLGMSLATTARAQTGGVQIWYRAGEGCPDGATFVQRLTGLGREARLAGVGDRVDFVVTVASTNGGASGRLERQTEQGQMAIRDIEAPLCAEVADGLALSLDLALEPPAAKGLDENAAAREDVAVREPGASWSLGAEGSWMAGIAPSGLPGIGAFVEWSGSGGAPSLRLGGRGSQTSGAVADGVDVDVVLLLGRLEACPWAWSRADFSLRPCLAFDLGGMRASSSESVGRSDTGLWASGALLLRGAWQFSLPFSLELGLGGLVPFVRYELGAEEGAALYRTQPLALEASLGAAWRWP